MMNKHIYRGIVWAILIVAGVLITFNIYRIFVENTVIEDIENEKAIAKQYEGETGKIETLKDKIDDYNNQSYGDGIFEAMIPTGYDEKEIILHYVEAPLLIVDAEKLSVQLSEEMPTNIDWTSDTPPDNIHGVKVTLSFKINYNKLPDLITELKSNIRLIYFGNISYIVPENPDDIIQIKMNYFVFYKDAK